jgi:hypothetical protein
MPSHCTPAQPAESLFQPGSAQGSVALVQLAKSPSGSPAASKVSSEALSCATSVAYSVEVEHAPARKEPTTYPAAQVPDMQSAA